jgi:hypothetical protein
MDRMALWRGEGLWLAEAATVRLTTTGVRARGTQLGADPLPYRADYVLDAGEGFVTSSLRVDVAGDGWRRRLELRHDGDGRWSCVSEEHGDVDLPPAGGDAQALATARDCDLAHSPLTNLMPVRRHDLHRSPGAAELLTAWVSLPDLGVRPDPQRYEHVRSDGRGAVVRFTSLDPGERFVSDVVVDADGLVVAYPQIARRVAGGSS